MNKKAASVHVEKVLEEPDSTKVEVKQEEAEQGTEKTPGKVLKIKARKKARKPTHADSDNEHKSEKDEKNKKDVVESSEKGTHALKKRKRGPKMKRESKRKKTYSDLEEEGHLKTFLKINSIILTDMEQSASTTGSLNLMERFKTTTPEGIDLVLWGDLRTMFEANAKDELWHNQEGWNLKSWDFYENCGVHTLTLEDGTEIHMLAERRYPLRKETHEKMMSLKLIAESTSDSAYDLLKFIQKKIHEAGSHD
ncbi:hypothetical protein Tco_0974958 [Tanacetum coccineum]|uniref:Uncharacterized protein n=1 Tax=Tanacetum coccineum TaxID=301880 RepID=A0ABQ5ED64_9ASTR